jgi:hypothetical protein
MRRRITRQMIATPPIMSSTRVGAAAARGIKAGAEGRRQEQGRRIEASHDVVSMISSCFEDQDARSGPMRGPAGIASAKASLIVRI